MQIIFIHVYVFWECGGYEAHKGEHERRSGLKGRQTDRMKDEQNTCDRKPKGRIVRRGETE